MTHAVVPYQPILVDRSAGLGFLALLQVCLLFRAIKQSEQAQRRQFHQIAAERFTSV